MVVDMNVVTLNGFTDCYSFRGEQLGNPQVLQKEQRQCLSAKRTPPSDGQSPGFTCFVFCSFVFLFLLISSCISLCVYLLFLVCLTFFFISCLSYLRLSTDPKP